MRRLLLIIALALVAPAAASAHTTLVTPDGQPIGGRWQQWVDRSLVPTPDATLVVSFTNPSDSSRAAYFTPDESKSTLYVPDPAKITRHMLLHELGHFYDYSLLTDTGRAAIMRFVLAGLREWRQPGGDSAHEQFAEAFAFAATYRRWRDDGHGESMSYGLDQVMTARRFRLLTVWLTNIPLLPPVR